MKTLVVSVVIVMTSVFNAFSNGNLPEFAYDVLMNGDRVESQTVYTVENGKYLHQHLKYNYMYDANGNIAQKEVLKWSEITKVFEKQYCLNYTHNTKETSIEYVVWNAETEAYSDAKAKTVYQTAEAGQGLHYLSYEWSKKENGWNLTDRHAILSPNDALLANK